MKKIKLPILVANLYLLVCQIALFTGAKSTLIAILFGVAPFIVVLLVIRTLKMESIQAKY